MKFIHILFCFSLPSFSLIFGQALENNKVLEFTSSNLPIIVINTNGQTIIDEDKITADMGAIYNGEGTRNYLTDPFNNYNGKIGIEIRGSSSQMFPKKAYAVETRDSNGDDLDVSLLDLPLESDWVLYAPYNDKSLIRDVLAYRLANDMGRYASKSKFCEVVLNSEYIGIYVLLEKIKRDANRVNIKKLDPEDISGDALTGGYIIKIDKTDGENNDGWLSTYLPYPQAHYPILYQYHVPKPDEITPEQKSYIQGIVFNFETTMKYNSNIADSATGYPKYIDIGSFVDFILLNEFVRNVDAYRLSTFLYKDRDSRNPKIFAGPIWDFNLAFGNADYHGAWLVNGWQIEYLSEPQNMGGEAFLTPFWWKKLFDETNFRKKFFNRWENLKNNVLSVQSVYHYIDSLTTLINEARVRNFEKWPVIGVQLWPNYFVGQTYEQEINYLKSWISNRFTWLDENMIGEPTNVTEQNSYTPNDFSILQNFPNPFNSTTTIRFSVPIETFVTVKIYDILGNLVNVPIEETMKAGNYFICLNLKDYSSGIYIYKLNAQDFSASKKLILLN